MSENWIPVSRELPDERLIVLVVFGDYVLRAVRDAGWRECPLFGHGAKLPTRSVSHWMRLPKVPSTEPAHA